jgi:hypothetical protein
MEKALLAEQTTAAFDYLERLYTETTFLIKELEGHLKQEKEEFLIGRGKGYSVNAYSSTSLASTEWWLYKKLSVFYAPKEHVVSTGRGTSTALKNGLKIVYLKILYREATIRTPKVLLGVISQIESANQTYKRMEDVITPFFDNLLKWEKGESAMRERSFKDGYLAFQEKYFVRDLFDINSSNDVQEKLLKPVLVLYRQAE